LTELLRLATRRIRTSTIFGGVHARDKRRYELEVEDEEDVIEEEVNDTYGDNVGDMSDSDTSEDSESEDDDEEGYDDSYEEVDSTLYHPIVKAGKFPVIYEGVHWIPLRSDECCIHNWLIKKTVQKPLLDYAIRQPQNLDLINRMRLCTRASTNKTLSLSYIGGLSCKPSKKSLIKPFCIYATR
jgi:hypothetical protein